MSTELWKPMTNATIAYEYKQNFLRFADLTGANKDFIPFQGHDFSSRGLSNREDGYKSGIAHLTSFVGTDTCLAIQGAKDFYNADYTKELVGTSVPATEHSVMSLSGMDDELGTFRRLITELYPSGIVSIVSDTWDFWKVLTEYTVTLKDEILNRTPNALGLAKVVFRPDSGNPADILCGLDTNKIYIMDLPYIDSTWDIVEIADNFYCNYYNNINMFIYKGTTYTFEFDDEDPDFVVNVVPIEKTAEQKGAVEVLWDIFGGTINDKGYKVLNGRVGLIYGDSITLDRQVDILQRLADKGFDSSNVVFGIGSYSYQYSTRDTFGFAMKATYGEVNGVGREIFKDPVTDSGTKKSAKGLLSVQRKPNGELCLVDQCTPTEEKEGLLSQVFINGKLTNETTLAKIRARLESYELS